MAKQTLKYGFNSIVVIVSFALILAVFNYFSFRYFKRVDITSEKAYTITESSKKILAKLKDTVRVKVYMSEKLPPNLLEIKRDIVDLLEEYSVYSKGKLRVEFIDPSDNKEVEESLAAKGIQKHSITVLEKEKLESSAIYLSAVVEFGDKSETIPLIQSQTLEYDMTSALLKVTADKEKGVGILFNAPEDDKDYLENYTVLQEFMQKTYSLRKIETRMLENELKTLETLIIVGPQDFKDRELFLIDQFVMHGGKLIVLMDTVKFAKNSMMPSKKIPNLNQLLEHYGVKVNDDLVLEHDMRGQAMAAFNMGYMAVQMPYPFYIKILPGGYDKKHPVVSRLSEVIMPWASSLTFSDKLPKEIEKTELISSSKTATHQTDNFDINPQKRYNVQKESDLKQYTLAGILSGKFTSYYKGKEEPKTEGEQPQQKNSPPKLDEAEKPSQIVVVGNSRFAEDRRCFQQTYGGLAIGDNAKFLLNAVDWTTMGDELINIRTRQIEARPLKEISDSARGAYKFFGTFGISLIVVVMGVLRIFIKRVRRERLEGVYLNK